MKEEYKKILESGQKHTRMIRPTGSGKNHGLAELIAENQNRNYILILKDKEAIKDMNSLLIRCGVNPQIIQEVVSGVSHEINGNTKVILTHHTYAIYKPFSHTCYDIFKNILEWENAIIWIDEADEYYNKVQVVLSNGAYYKRIAGSAFFRCDRADLFSTYVPAANRVGINDGVPFCEPAPMLPCLESISLGIDHLKINVDTFTSYKGYVSNKLLLHYKNIEKDRGEITPLDWNFKTESIDYKRIKSNITTYIREMPKFLESVSIVDKMVMSANEVYSFSEIHEGFENLTREEKDEMQKDIQVPYYRPETIIQGLDLRALKDIRNKNITFIEVSATFSAISEDAMNIVWGANAIVDKKESSVYWNSPIRLFHTQSDLTFNHKINSQVLNFYKKNGARDTDKSIDILHFMMPSLRKLVFTTLKKKTENIASRFCLTYGLQRSFLDDFNSISIDLTYSNSTVGRGSNNFKNNDVVFVPLKVIKPPFAFYGESEEKVVIAAQKDAKNVALQNIGRIIRKDSEEKDKTIVLYGVEKILLSDTIATLKSMAKHIEEKELIYKKETDQEILIDICNKITKTLVSISVKSANKFVDWTEKYQIKIAKLANGENDINQIKRKLRFNDLSPEKQELINEILNKNNNDIGELICNL